MSSRKRAHAQELAQGIIDSQPLCSVTLDQIETWSDDDLYDWLETWGYTWEHGAWVDLEDIDYPDDDPVSVVDFF